MTSARSTSPCTWCGPPMTGSLMTRYYTISDDQRLFWWIYIKTNETRTATVTVTRKNIPKFKNWYRQCAYGTSFKDNYFLCFSNSQWSNFALKFDFSPSRTWSLPWSPAYPGWPAATASPTPSSTTLTSCGASMPRHSSTKIFSSRSKRSSEKTDCEAQQNSHDIKSLTWETIRIRTLRRSIDLSGFGTFIN